MTRGAGVTATAAAAALALASCGAGGVLSGSGGGGGGGGDTPRPRPPVSRVTAPEGTVSNRVTFQFVLSDPQVGGDPADGPFVRVRPQFIGERDQLGQWRDMTEAAPGAGHGLALPLGRHVFVWESATDLGRVEGRYLIRVLAEYEPTEGNRRGFRTDTASLAIDNQRGATVAGRGADPDPPAEATPVDIRADGDGFLVASLGANIVERIGADGDPVRVCGLGVAGEPGTDPVHAGVVRLPAISSFDALPGGHLVTAHGHRLFLVQRGADEAVFGLADGDDPDSDPDTATAARGSVAPVRMPDVTDVRCVRMHSSGAVLLCDRSADGRSVVRAANPQDPADIGASPVLLAGISIPPGGSAVVAGGGLSREEGVAATAAELREVESVAVGPSGEIFLAESADGRIRVVNTDAADLALGPHVIAPGAVLTVAGAGPAGSVGEDVDALGARLDRPLSLAAGAAHTFFVADHGRNAVRLVNLGAADVTVAGTTVRPGNIGTIVGRGIGGLGSSAREYKLTGPRSVCIDPVGHLLIAEGAGVLFVNATSTAVEAYGRSAGPERTAAAYDAAPRGGQPLDAPSAVHALSPRATEAFFTDRTTVRVLNQGVGERAYGGAVAATGGVAVIAGGSVEGFAGDGGPARNSALARPMALAGGAGDLLYVADTGNDRIRAIHLAAPDSGSAAVSVLGVTIAPGNVDTLVGGALGPLPEDGDGSPAAACSLLGPQGLSVDPAGIVWIADTGHHRIRAVNTGPTDASIAGVTVAAGTIRTVVGDGTAGFSPDGALPVRVDRPGPLVADGRLVWFCDATSARVRALNVSAAPVSVADIVIAPGEVRTVAGSGTPGNFGDFGAATSARIGAPSGLFVETVLGQPRGLYVSDAANHVLRIVNVWNTQGNVAAIDVDVDVGRDANENLLRISPGAIYTLAGGPNAAGAVNPPSFAGDGRPLVQMRFDTPRGVTVISTTTVLPSSHLLVCDDGNDRLRRAGPPSVRPQSAVP